MVSGERSKGPVAHQELAGQVFHGDFIKDLTKQWPGGQRNIPNGASAERRARDFDTVSQVAGFKFQDSLRLTFAIARTNQGSFSAPFAEAA